MTVSPTVVPNLSDSARGANTSLHVLREKCDASKILGLIRYKRNEILVVYDGQHISTRSSFSTFIYYLFIFQNLVVTLTTPAYRSVQVVIFHGSEEPQRIPIVEATSCYSRPNLSR